MAAIWNGRAPAKSQPKSPLLNKICGLEGRNRNLSYLNLESQFLRPSTEVPHARHWKQPENSRKGCRAGHGRTAEKQPEEQPKHLKNNQNSCFFRCFGCSSGCSSAVLPWPTRHPFRLFSGCLQCRAFGTSVEAADIALPNLESQSP